MKAKKKGPARQTPAEVITALIVRKLEEDGAAPWRKAWGGRGGMSAWPTNAVKGTPYRGANVIVLGLCSGFGCQLWATFKQAQSKGWIVPRGTKGWPVVFWNWNLIDKKGGRVKDSPANRKRGDVKSVPFLRRYTVFNLEQLVQPVLCECGKWETRGRSKFVVGDEQCTDCGGTGKLEEIPVPLPAVEIRSPDFKPIEACEELVAAYKGRPRILPGGTVACYSPTNDTVRTPTPQQFDSPEAYYATLFHELGHSTGHPNRLNRPGIADFDGFGSHQYSKEELVAEITSAFMCGLTGIAPAVLDNQAAYVKHWATTLKGDPKLIVSAAGQAQKAFDLIQGRDMDKEMAARAAAEAAKEEVAA